jgi:hypothetical protein
VTVTSAVPLRLPLVARMVALPVVCLGALYRPVLLIEPMPPGSIDQVNTGCVAGIEGETDGDLLTGVEGLAGRLVGGDDEEFDLAEAELALDLLGIERKDFLGGLQNGIRDEGSEVGAGFDAAAEEVIEGFGIGALAAHFVFETARTDHGRHLRSKRDQVIREVRSTGLPRRCQVAQNRMSSAFPTAGLKYCQGGSILASLDGITLAVDLETEPVVCCPVYWQTPLVIKPVTALGHPLG